MIVTRAVYKRFPIEKVIPAIKDKWPNPPPYKVKLEQENAKVHVLLNEPDVVAAKHRNRQDVDLVAQPPNSPDLNTIDLGFFVLFKH